MGAMYKAEEAIRAAKNAGHLRFRYLATDWSIVTIHLDSLSATLRIGFSSGVSSSLETMSGFDMPVNALS
jgi:hypothetical protein